MERGRVINEVNFGVMAKDNLQNEDGHPLYSYKGLNEIQKKEYSKKQRTEDLQYLLNIMRILKLMIFILKKKTEIRCAMLTVI